MQFSAFPIPKTISTGKYTFEVFDTPGYVKCHNVFFERNQGWLFSGDLYVSTKLKVCFFEVNKKQTIATIEKLLDLDFDTIFRAHSGVVENGKVVLLNKLDFLKELQERFNALCKQGLPITKLTRCYIPIYRR